MKHAQVLVKGITEAERRGDGRELKRKKLRRRIESRMLHVAYRSWTSPYARISAMVLNPIEGDSYGRSVTGQPYHRPLPFVY